MKNLLLLFFSVSFCLSLIGGPKIYHTDFGDGWSIALNENVAVDMDGDGIDDFYINQALDELGFTSITNTGCFASPSFTSYTTFGARTLSRFEEGDQIYLEDTNMFDYIDDDRGSCYKAGDGFAYGWWDDQDYYVGVALLSITPNFQPGIKDAWIKVALDETSQSLIIKEWAFTDYQTEDSQGIVAGQTGKLDLGEEVVEDNSSSPLSDVGEMDDLKSITISPNPASEDVRISYDYTGSQQLAISIHNFLGQVIFAQQVPSVSASETFPLAAHDWETGTYSIRFVSDVGIKTKQLVIAR